MNTQSQIPLAQLRRGKQARFNPLSGLATPDDVAKKLDAFEAGYFKDAVTIWDALEQRDDLIRTVVSKRKKAVGRQGWTILIKESLPAARQPEAQAHAAALEHFYGNLRCENALDRAEEGLARQGSSRLAVPTFKLLCRQMMDAVGKRFAVHEIIWNLGRADVSSAEEGVPPDSSPSVSSESSVVQNSAPSVVQNPPLFSSFPSVENSSRASRSSREIDSLTATFRFVPLSFFKYTTGELSFPKNRLAS